MTSAKLGLAAGVVVLAIAGTFVWLGGRPASSDQGKPPTHMHCPKCLMEMTFDPARAGKNCPQCGVEGPKLIATVGSFKNRDITSGLAGKIGNIIAAVVIAGAVIQVSVYGWIMYSRKRRQAEAEAQNQSMVCRCPFCDRKIGFTAKMAGATIVCARCKTAFPLPEGVRADEA